MKNQKLNIACKLLQNFKLLQNLLFLIVFGAMFLTVQIQSFEKKDTVIDIKDSVATTGTAGNNETESGVFTNKQDSAYKQDMRLSLPYLFMIRRSLDASEFQWSLWLKSMENEPSISLSNSFARMPEGIFNPTAEEIVQYHTNMEKMLSIPTVYTFHNTGLNINIRDAGIFLGIVEDVSPVISYKLPFTSDVEIVIYSMNAKVIATIFRGTQRQGNYTITWNGKDDNGKKMPYGDYIAEVRIGFEKFYRKRIVIN